MRSSVRWLVPVAAAAVVAGGVAVNSASASSASSPPKRSVEQVLAALAGSDVTALSGTVVTRADIGFPSLPSMGGRSSGATSSTDVQGLVTRFLSGENTLRVYQDGRTKLRAQLLDKFDELNVVRNGDQVWTYDSRHNTVQHGIVPKDTGKHAGTRTDTPGSSASPGSQLTPAEMANRALAAADPTTRVSLGDPERVAGRSAYALTLTPTTSATLIDRVVIAVDAAKSVPLQVQVFARDTSQPVIETGFTEIDFATPAASTFEFTAPKGATVTEMGSGAPSSGAHPDAKTGTATKTGRAAGTGARPTEIGTGWATILEMPAQQAGALSQAQSGNGSTPGEKSAGSLLSQLGTSVAGGRAITTKLVSVLITDDGRVFAGAVPVQSLIDAAKR
jgi:outer membrane lipoprotein-sorting protein